MTAEQRLMITRLIQISRAMAQRLVKMGKLEAAASLYKQSLRYYQRLLTGGLEPAED